MSGVTVDLWPEPPEYAPDASTAVVTVDLADPAAVFTVDLAEPMAGTIVDLAPDPADDVAVTIPGAVIVDLQPGDANLLVPGNSPVIIAEVGGCVGPPGPPGPAGDGGMYRHTQNIAADVWLIVHLLGCNPNVSVTDTAGSLVYGDVTYVNESTLRIVFSEPLAGAAFLS